MAVGRSLLVGVFGVASIANRGAAGPGALTAVGVVAVSNPSNNVVGVSSVPKGLGAASEELCRGVLVGESAENGSRSSILKLRFALLREDRCRPLFVVCELDSSDALCLRSF